MYIYIYVIDIYIYRERDIYIYIYIYIGHKRRFLKRTKDTLVAHKVYHTKETVDGISVPTSALL